MKLSKTHIGVGAALIAAVCLGATIVAFGNAQSDKEAPRKPGTVFDLAQETEIKAIVKEYLMEHPDTILEALQGYEEQQRELADAATLEGARENLKELLASEDGYIVGADTSNASVAVIEMFDYHCGFCKRAMGRVQDLARKDKAVQVVFRELPILRQESELAARAALASRAQGKYADMHFALMGAEGVLDQKRINEIAAKQGVDVAALEKGMDDPSVDRALSETLRIAQDMGVNGTPAFIVASLDGDFVEVIPGFDEEALIAAIDEAKTVAKKSGGTAN